MSNQTPTIPVEFFCIWTEKSLKIEEDRAVRCFNLEYTLVKQQRNEKAGWKAARNWRITGRAERPLVHHDCSVCLPKGKKWSQNNVNLDYSLPLPKTSSLSHSFLLFQRKKRTKKRIIWFICVSAVVQVMLVSPRRFTWMSSWLRILHSLLGHLRRYQLL